MKQLRGSKSGQPKDWDLGCPTTHQGTEHQGTEVARGDLPNNNALIGSALRSAQLHHQAGMVGKTGHTQLLGVPHRADPRIEGR